MKALFEDFYKEYPQALDVKKLRENQGNKSEFEQHLEQK